jgi:Polyketide cyclase / dehydrase and lipid transport
MTVDVLTEDAPDRVERRSVVVDASAAEIFDLLADPTRHREIDGSGTIRDAAPSAPSRLSKGAKFGMSMKWFVPYRMTNEVVEFVENTTIAWRHVGGHIWRYTLQEVQSATENVRCKVTEEFDWRPSKAPFVLTLMGAPKSNAESIEKTLARLADKFG